MTPLDFEHSQLVQRLIKDPQILHSELEPFDAGLIHAVLGIAGEAGELVDAIKKVVIYRKQIDYSNLIEELGDMEFFLQDLRSRLGLTRDETLVANMAKLRLRYPEGYSNASAQQRADKTLQPD